MARFILRLDDFASRYHKGNWDKLELLLDTYSIKPLVGLIPDCQDTSFENYEADQNFWERAASWINKGWTIALHGCTHVYNSNWGGINPVNQRSEFAGRSLAEQKQKIRTGVSLFRKNLIDPVVFFAPSHTFDENTLAALREESSIRIISDTIAYDSYEYMGFTFVPQQSGAVRNLPFHTVTFCYHPNTMSDNDFDRLEKFVSKYRDRFINFPLDNSTRTLNFIDKILKTLYFSRK